MMTESIMGNAKAENANSARAIKNIDLRRIWEFLTAVENRHKSFSVYDVSILADIDYNNCGKRVSDLRGAGLIVDTGTKTFENRGGRDVTYTTFKAACYDDFDTIYDRLKYEVRIKELKVNTVGVEGCKTALDLFRDRSLSVDHRMKVLGMFISACEHIITNNPQVKEEDLKNRFKANPGTYDMMPKFISEYSDKEYVRVDNDAVNEHLDDVSQVDDIIKEKNSSLIEKLLKS